MTESRFCIAMYRWTTTGSIGTSIANELAGLGHEVIALSPDQEIPDHSEIVFTYAPYGRWMPFVRRIQKMPPGARPILVHWNTEGLPPDVLPPGFLRILATARSTLDEAVQRRGQTPILRPLSGLLERRMLRYRYMGDYLRAQQSGIPFLLVDISNLYRDRMRDLGIPAISAPYGSSNRWYADLGLPRDIDVLWIGAPGSRRRARILSRLQQDLSERGINFRVIDGQTAPFVHGEKRTRMLNRTKIVLNILRQREDDNTLRMFIAMPNRAMVISEPIRKHNDYLEPNVHFAESAVSDLPDTIAHFLENEREREAFVERAYRMSTEQATMRVMVEKIMAAAAARFRRLKENQ